MALLLIITLELGALVGLSAVTATSNRARCEYLQDAQGVALICR